MIKKIHNLSCAAYPQTVKAHTLKDKLYHEFISRSELEDHITVPGERFRNLVHKMRGS